RPPAARAAHDAAREGGEPHGLRAPPRPGAQPPRHVPRAQGHGHARGFPARAPGRGGVAGGLHDRHRRVHLRPGRPLRRSQPLRQRRRLVAGRVVGGLPRLLAGPGASARAPPLPSRRGLRPRLPAGVVRGAPAARAACQLTAVYLRRDRETKTRLYPSLGFFLLLPVAQLFSRATYSLTAGAFVSVLILGMLPSVILEAVRTSSHHAASEI